MYISFFVHNLTIKNFVKMLSSDHPLVNILFGLFIYNDYFLVWLKS